MGMLVGVILLGVTTVIGIVVSLVLGYKIKNIKINQVKNEVQ